jgi:phosphate/sulfate permease
MDSFITIMAFAGLALLVWNCAEVGRNDAANLLNAVFGARILTRGVAVALATIAVIAGASAATPVMETARSGIFDPASMDLKAAMVVYISVYLVGTVLLYSYSSFGMPVSTTACLVLQLVGASYGLYGASVVQWSKVGEVLAAIVVSILLAGLGGYLIQRVFRAAIRDKTQDPQTILLHGPWMAGLMFTWLSWFMVLKGLSGMPVVQTFQEQAIAVYGAPSVLLVTWGLFTLLVHVFLTVTGRWGATYLFHITAVIGMLSMAFAFGQNDLANAAGPGLAAFWLWQNSDTTVRMATEIPIPVWVLFLAGVVISLGMSTPTAQRVTRAATNTGSQFDRVALYAPNWCQAIARWLVRKKHGDEGLAPPPALTPEGKKVHYDALRASVIMSVSASIIALASSQGLPVSTTYVGFAAVIFTGVADRVLARGDAHLKIGRAIWVVTSWFVSALIALVATAVAARAIYHMELVGFAMVLAANLGVRFIAKRRSDAQETRIHGRIGTKDLDYQDDPLHAAPLQASSHELLGTAEPTAPFETGRAEAEICEETLRSK